MKKEKLKLLVEPKSFWARSAIVLMGMSVLFRLIGCWGRWTDQFFAVTQILLPIASGLLFILLVLLLGRRALWTTSLPVLMGVAFFFIKSMGFESKLHMLLCMLLYLLVAALYVGTVFTFIRAKWLLTPLFALPFLYHVFVEDLARLRDAANPVSFAEGMQEMSVLCIMLSLLFLSFAMKTNKPQLEDADLPRIKPPKVIPPRREEPESAPEDTGAPEAAPQSEDSREEPETAASTEETE